MDHTPGDLYAGRTLGGQYELLVPLAQGATASVWAARLASSALEKIVAVKVMITEFSADADTESMFLDEARLVSRIRHPNVASVLDLGEEDDALFIVMEWVDGEPLQVLMREARANGIPPLLAVRIAKLAAAGLHAAHELTDEAGKPMNLVHRDVSPQNILIGYDGSVKVIDFGVAKAASNLQKTSVGQIKGKVPYMAPEQAVGDRVDRRTDVFALGTVLYQLVTGKHPFRGDNEFATLARLRDPKPVDPPSTLAKVPPELDEVICKALAKDRNQRYASMLEFARALEKALPSGPDEERVLGELARSLLAQRAVKRNREVREALRSLGHTKRPVNLSQIFDEEPSRNVPAATLTAPVAAPAAPQRPVVQPVAAPPPADPRPAAFPPNLDESPTVTAFQGEARRNRIKLIAAGVVLVLAVIIGFVALFGGGGAERNPDGTRIKRAF